MSDLGALRGRTPFPLAGEECYLRYKTEDKLALQEEFGDEWFTGADTRIMYSDIKFMMALLKYGVKKDDKRFSITLDDLEEKATPAEIGTILLDAIYVSMHGMSYVDYLVDLRKRMSDNQKLSEDADPSLAAPPPSSTGSKRRATKRG